MKLEELYQDFALLDPVGKLSFVSEYRVLRSYNLKSEVNVKTRKVPETTSFTEQEKLLMKLLGLKAKDLRALKALKEERSEVEETDDDSELSAATLFDENNTLLESEE